MTKAKIQFRCANNDFWGIRNMFPAENLKNIKLENLHFALEQADLYRCSEIWNYLEQIYRKKISSSRLTPVVNLDWD